MLVPVNVFQRLMSADPGESLLRPDAARDCLFTATTVYTCTLNDELFFHNGHELTSRDVKFSIDRATRLAVPGSSANLLDSIRRIETPDEQDGPLRPQPGGHPDRLGPRLAGRVPGRR